MTKTVKKSGVNIREWVRDRIVFLAVAIFVIGAGAYISAEQVFDAHSIWLHPVREFALLISLIGVISLGYEVFLRELTFNEYKEALEEIVNPDAVRLGIHGIYKNRSELAQATSFEDLFKNVKEEVFKRFYKPIYLLLLSMIACLLFFISKENKRFTLYKYIIFFIGIAAIILSELLLRYASNNIIGFYFFITFPLFSILSLYIFSFIKSKINF